MILKIVLLTTGRNCLYHLFLRNIFVFLCVMNYVDIFEKFHVKQLELTPLQKYSQPFMLKRVGKYILHSFLNVT